MIEGPLVDDLQNGNTPIWVVVTRDDADLEIDRPLLTEEDCENVAPMRVCRAVLEDGTVLIGNADEEQHEAMSDLLLVDRCGEA